MTIYEDILDDEKNKRKLWQYTRKLGKNRIDCLLLTLYHWQRAQGVSSKPIFLLGSDGNFYSGSILCQKVLSLNHIPRQFSSKGFDINGHYGWLGMRQWMWWLQTPVTR